MSDVGEILTNASGGLPFGIRMFILIFVVIIIIAIMLKRGDK